MSGRGYSGGGMGFGPPVTPPVIKQLILANVAVFFAQMLQPQLFSVMTASPSDFWQRGFVWQPFTYMWMHGGLGHILANMFGLWMFGSQVALVWGPQRFLRFYLLCGVGAGLLIVSYPWIPVLLGASSTATLHYPTLGASGAIFGVLLAYSLTWPDRTIMLIFPPVAFRAIWLIPLLFFMEIYFGPPNVSHVGHLGGVLIGWLLLRGQGDARGLLSFDQIRWRFKRWQMRKRLRSVQTEQSRNSNDRPYFH
ncbi:MAG: gluP 3 [Deltaproteobacteria bacterium]|nr:gluP 3 [Deltaproteobacteria bacterium]